jgi:hypothetical protein
MMGVARSYASQERVTQLLTHTIEHLFHEQSAGDRLTVPAKTSATVMLLLGRISCLTCDFMLAQLFEKAANQQEQTALFCRAGNDRGLFREINRGVPSLRLEKALDFI